MSNFLIEVKDEFDELLILNKFHISSIKPYQDGLSRIILSNGNVHYVKMTTTQLKGKINADK
jgi:hypothetical protein